jgi:Methyltransferase domain
VNDLERYHKARWAYRLGRTERAIELCSQGNFFKCDRLKSRILNPEPHYTQILRRFHETTRPVCYLEIGVAGGDTFRLSDAHTRIGVDPAPACDMEKIYRMTSDEFFQSHAAAYQPDMVFIDGSHRYETALRDFYNAERIMKPTGTIFLHDVLPLDERTATPERHTDFWSGDVWRTYLLLWEQRPDLHFHLFRSPPTGLLMVSNLDPANTYLKDNYPTLVSDYLSRDFADRLR